jgi:hypothetical protein
MKKLLFIILISFSMQSFAKTFVCENWSNFLRQELEGTMFEGEIDGDTFIISDEVKIKRTLTYIGTDTVFKYFTRFDKDFIRIYSINIDNPIGQTKYSEDGKTKLRTYDLKIAELWGVGLKYVTFCNYK